MRSIKGVKVYLEELSIVEAIPSKQVLAPHQNHQAEVALVEFEPSSPVFRCYSAAPNRFSSSGTSLGGFTSSP